MCSVSGTNNAQSANSYCFICSVLIIAKALLWALYFILVLWVRHCHYPYCSNTKKEVQRVQVICPGRLTYQMAQVRFRVRFWSSRLLSLGCVCTRGVLPYWPCRLGTRDPHSFIFGTLKASLFSTEKASLSLVLSTWTQDPNEWRSEEWDLTIVTVPPHLTCDLYVNKAFHIDLTLTCDIWLLSSTWDSACLLNPCLGMFRCHGTCQGQWSSCSASSLLVCTAEGAAST